MLGSMLETDYITPEMARTLPGLLQERVHRSADKAAYGYHDVTHGWVELSW